MRTKSGDKHGRVLCDSHSMSVELWGPSALYRTSSMNALEAVSLMIHACLHQTKAYLDQANPPIGRWY
jgi:hypothetical protein